MALPFLLPTPRNSEFTLTLQTYSEEKRARVRSRRGRDYGASVAIFAGVGLQR